jgi:hypothetical protein
LTCEKKPGIINVVTFEDTKFEGGEKDMNLATVLLRASHIGIRELKEHLSTEFLKEPLVITDRGEPVSINLPYSDVLELIDILDEFSDAETLAAVQEGRNAISGGARGITVSTLFRKTRKK